MNTSGREIETKLTLDAGNFSLLASACDRVGQKVMTNCYYDSGKKFQQSGGVFRIRYIEHNISIMTYKEVVNVKGGRRDSIEIEERVFLPNGDPPAVLLLHALPEAFRAPLKAKDVTVLKLLGSMKVIRTTYTLPSGIEVDFDNVLLPDGLRFFEVEIEHEDEDVHERALEEISEMVPFEFSQKSKFQRFLESLTNAR